MKAPNILALTLAVTLALFGNSVRAQTDSSGSSSDSSSAASSSSGSDSSAAGGGSDSGAPDAGSDTAVAPMYGSTFKCSDGYNPDTDPTLHPPGQNPKVRMLVNAQAQQKHEDEVKAEKQKAAMQDQPDKPAAKQTAPSAYELQLKEDKERAAAEKKAQEQQKKDEEEKKKAEEKEQSEKKSKKKDDKDSKPVSLGPYNPLKDAIFSIQSHQFQASIDVLSKVLSANENDIQAHYLMGVSYVGLKKFDKAAVEYNTVLKLAPTSKVAGLASEGLKKIGK